MANIGQMRPDLLLENGLVGQLTFQAADGIREDGPLLAVSEVNARGNPAWFDGERSFILPGDAPQVATMRSLVQQVAQKVPLHLKNGVFKMRAWQAGNNAGFPRPGVKA